MLVLRGVTVPGILGVKEVKCVLYIPVAGKTYLFRVPYYGFYI